MKYMIFIKDVNSYFVSTGYMTYSYGDILQATKFDTKEEAQKEFKQCQLDFTWRKATIVEYENFSLWDN